MLFVLVRSKVCNESWVQKLTTFNSWALAAPILVSKVLFSSNKIFTEFRIKARIMMQQSRTSTPHAPSGQHRNQLTLFLASAFLLASASLCFSSSSFCVCQRIQAECTRGSDRFVERWYLQAGMTQPRARTSTAHIDGWHSTAVPRWEMACLHAFTK